MRYWTLKKLEARANDSGVRGLVVTALAATDLPLPLAGFVHAQTDIPAVVGLWLHRPCSVCSLDQESRASLEGSLRYPHPPGLLRGRCVVSKQGRELAMRNMREV